ncbi:MAG: hypothetical protein SGJ19_04085 [Planctomycetia bacterium]|nr:hypothetical protein [Planctomycetia bacterium]
MLARALGLLVIISVLSTQSGIAGQISLDRSWAGRLSITIGGLGGQYVDAVRIPASLHSVLDDVSDTFTIQSLV